MKAHGGFNCYMFHDLYSIFCVGLKSKMATITGYRNIDKNCFKKSKTAELIEPKLYMNEH